jgi:mono/diheme cytochrome c family protein
LLRGRHYSADQVTATRYDEIVAQITSGIPKEQSRSGIAMPPKGGGTLSDDDVKAIAAYVHSLSHK